MKRFVVLSLLVASIAAPGVSAAACATPDLAGFACVERNTADGCTVRGWVSTGYNWAIACARVSGTAISMSAEVVAATVYSTAVAVADGRSTRTVVCLNEPVYYLFVGAGGCSDVTVRHDPGRYDVGIEGVSSAYYGVLSNCQRARITYDTDEGQPIRISPSVYC